MLLFILSIFTLVELNCENLFDTKKDSVKDDSEFTAESLRHWDKRKYFNKIYNIGREIISCAEEPVWSMPDLVALCEVENDSVMHDLTQRTMLWSMHYEYIVTNSPDERGVNVALMYSPLTFNLLNTYSLRVTPIKGMRPTRDILYAKGIAGPLDTLHVFVVHSPSRYGGEKETMENRMAVMRRLEFSIDSIREESLTTNIIVAGDFNDYSTDPALRYLSGKEMFEVSKEAKGFYCNSGGTYKYKGIWNSLDHIFLSSCLKRYVKKCYINDREFLMEEDEYGELQPKRNYRGYKYKNGYSDHLPLVLVLEKE